ncbi:MAG: ribosome biogenesis GTPase YlqF [Lachnospiraceae bacterium]|nr:ribosome biogenesis GTPase YlqF [Lachnospiraceae bacterium]
MSDNTINWYPGHMTKAVRMMKEEISLVDLIIELLDARAPLSSRNPDIDDLGKNKFRLVILNKADLANKGATEKWKAFFKEKGITVITMDARNRGNTRSVDSIVKEVCKEKIERDRKRGIKNRPIRAMVCGIPNVGKSTFINSFVGKGMAKTGNKPGVTKGKQWIRLSDSIELLDTPGILWPKIGDEQVGLRLALLGTINDNILDIPTLSIKLIDFLVKAYPGVLAERYSLSEEDDSLKILENIAINRRALKKGEEPDSEKAASYLIDDFRTGRLGNISLESPENENVNE